MPLILNGTTGVSGVDGSAGTPSYQGTDTNTGIFYPAADTIAFAEGGVEVARFDSSGNFGLGVTPSAWGSGGKAIQVGAYTSLANDGNGSLALTSNAYESATNTWRYIASLGASRYRQNFGDHAWFTAPSGTAGNTITWTQAMTLDSSGNVGIGTSSPLARLDVVFSSGRNRFRNSTGGESFLMLQNTDTGTNDDGLLVGIGADEVAYVYNYENTALVFGTNATERMRIRSDGGILSQPTGGGTLLEQFGCRAWVNFTGTGTLTINGSGNISSVTDNGVGSFRPNFSTNLPDGNYTINVNTWQSSSTSGVSQNPNNPTTTGFTLTTFENNVNTDPNRCFVVVFR